METRALEAARASGLIEKRRPLLVMLSGGADSVCLLDVAIRLGADPSVLHVNYGLRPEADEDERHCRDLCARLGVPLTVERVTLGSDGNLQAAARDARYALAERHADGDYASAHTLSDQAETVLYRLASSPGARALGGMRPRRGRLVRPLLTATHADTVAHCRAVGLDWGEDASNADPRFARSRIRHEVLPVLEEIAPGAAERIAATSGELRDERAALVALVDERLDAHPTLEELRALGPAMSRLAVRELCARAGGPALSVEAVERIFALGESGTVSLDVGDGYGAIVEYGRLSFTRAGEATHPEEALLPIPGRAVFGPYLVEAGPRAAGTHEVRLSAAAAGEAALVRGWQPGDRMRPAGLGGSRKLQDLFTDRKVPRVRRHELPLVVVDGEIAWVPGIAVAERFKPQEDEAVVLFSASRRP